MNIDNLKNAPGLNAKSLDDLREGDYVFYNGYLSQAATSILRITQTGLIVTEFGTFKKSGSQRGGDGWHINRIEPLSDRHVEFLLKQQTIKDARSAINFLYNEKLTYERALEILKMFDNIRHLYTGTKEMEWDNGRVFSYLSGEDNSRISPGEEIVEENQEISNREGVMKLE